MNTLYFKTTEEIRARRIYAEKEYKKKKLEEKRKQKKDLLFNLPSPSTDAFIKKINKTIRNHRYLRNKKNKELQLKLGI